MRLLDLFSRQGGGSVGYARAGFTVVGVDIEPQDEYPFEFHRGDALEFLAEHGHEFDAVAASPPCRDHTALTNQVGVAGTGWLLDATRQALIALGRPWVIENVPGAKMRRDLVLCGEMFGLGVIRHRWFELGGWTAEQPTHIRHRGRVADFRHGRWHDGPYRAVHGNGGSRGTVAEWGQAMGIDWMSRKADIAQAIPPAYTHLIGSELVRHLEES